MDSTTTNIRNSKKGFTLVEMLATLVIVVLFTMLLTTFIDLTSKYFQNTVRNSDAQTLASTLTNAIQDELRYATDIEIDASAEPNYTYFSTSLGLGKGCVLKHDKKLVNGEERYIILIESPTREDYPLINYGSYVYDVNAYIEAEYVNNKFEVVLTIKDSKDKEICKSEFSVVPLNPNLSEK